MNSKSHKDKIAITCFLVSAIVMFVLHTVSVVVDINPLTGYLTSGSKTGMFSLITLVLLIASAAVLLAFTRKRECRDTVFKSRSFGICSIAVAFLAVIESFSRYVDMKKNYISADGSKVIIGLQVVVMIVSAAAAIYLFALGFSMLDRKSNSLPPSAMCIALPLWAVARIAASYVEFTNQITLSERMYDIPIMCAFAITFVAFTRYVCGTGKNDTVQALSGYCLFTAAASLPVVAARFVASIGLGVKVVTSGWQDALLQIALSVFCLMLFYELGKPCDTAETTAFEAADNVAE